jgi:DNA modification methylase
VTPTDIIRENKPLRNAEHPTMKPVPLVGRFIAYSSRGGGCVLDPFGGSGSTLIACEQQGRHCRMMELDPVYCDVIIHRWETFTGQKAKRIER